MIFLFGDWDFEEIAGFSDREASELLSEILARPDAGQCWLVIEGDEVVGYILVCFVFSLEYRGFTAVIDEFYLAPGARGRGVGSRVLAMVEETLRAERIVHVEFDVGTGNSGARAFYERLGYSRREGCFSMGKRLARQMPGSRHLTAIEAMADPYRTLPPDAGETWEKDSRIRGGVSEEMRDPWDS